MKKIVASVAIASLALNVGLFAHFVWHWPKSVKASSKAASAAGSSDKLFSRDEIEAALQSGESKALADLGFTSANIRDFGLGRAFAQYHDRELASRAPLDPHFKYWKGSYPDSNDKALHLAERQWRDAQRVAFGDDTNTRPELLTDLAFLSKAKQSLLVKIYRDYSEMKSDIYDSRQGVLLPSDEAKLKWLQEEQDRDIAATLTPKERLEFDLRFSPAARTVQSRYGSVIETEEVYKKIYALQKGSEENPESTRGPLGEEPKLYAEEKIDQQVRALLGDETMAKAVKTNDPDRPLLAALQKRLGLPANTSDLVLTYRETYAAQSQMIVNDSGLTDQQRADQLKGLAQRAVADITARLGQEGTAAYAENAEWIKLLQQGSAYSTDIKYQEEPFDRHFAVFPVGDNKHRRFMISASDR